MIRPGVLEELVLGLALPVTLCLYCDWNIFNGSSVCIRYVGQSVSIYICVVTIRTTRLFIHLFLFSTADLVIPVIAH
jgi:hypothetical protein